MFLWDFSLNQKILPKIIKEVKTYFSHKSALSINLLKIIKITKNRHKNIETKEIHTLNL